MPKMALLLATDSLDKMRIFTDFLTRSPKANWRAKLPHRADTLRAYPRPINLYFFKDSIISYRAHCIDLARGRPSDWHLRLTPPEFRPDTEPYTVVFVLDRLEKVKDTHISEFPKWDNPNERIPQGNMTLFRVHDILDPRR